MSRARRRQHGGEIVLQIQQMNGAYLRIIKGDVKFRFVINVASLGRA